MKIPLLASLGAIAIAGVAHGQNVEERRGYVTIGLYYPSEISPFQQDLGASFSVGGNLVARERYRIGLELRGTSNALRSPGGSDDDFESYIDATISVGSIFANYSTRGIGGRGFFYGGGLGLARASVSQDDASVRDDDVRFVFAAFIGTDFSRTTFAQLRYQGASEVGYRGLSLEFGYRF